MFSTVSLCLGLHIFFFFFLTNCYHIFLIDRSKSLILNLNRDSLIYKSISTNPFALHIEGSRKKIYIQNIPASLPMTILI